VNLMLVMLLGGLWHGAAWTFVIWGAIHGAWLAFERFQGKDSPYRKLPRPVRVAITFLIVCIAWVFFRAADLPTAVAYLGAMFGVNDVQPGAGLVAGVIYDRYYLALVGLACVIAFAGQQTWDYTRKLSVPRIAVCFGLFWLALLLLESQTYNPFIYFIF
jgi:alginate O-acetyltransferase complex protein AlgI